MMFHSKLLSILIGAFLYLSIPEPESAKNTFVVKNSLNINRSFETVEIDLNLFELKELKVNNRYAIVDIVTKQEIVSQVIDVDEDGEVDQILFQPEMKPNSERVFEIIIKKKQTKDTEHLRCYSRFVPERTDDYAWENNRVAFRTYGPTAQKMVEENIRGGTLSSGIDAWLKRVEYPIINKWYEKTTSGKGSYHEDTGEGLDNFHVGVSRGVGGVAVKKDSTYYFSRNFTSWKTITNGSIRTSFVLEYENWDANGTLISEKKYISLDYGSNLSKFTIEIKGADTISAGLTLHKKDGEINTSIENGWISYWEPFGDSELGQGIVAPKSNMVGYQNYNTNKVDESNLYAHLKVTNNKVTYYAGFGWEKSGQFKSKEAWNNYLALFSKKINTPLTIKILNSNN
ncbi:DUF4861 family protein [Mariniflexile litorale]|uniref:DUF4861 family protein n=1 Tax=Mariniflexile litorale TaxID=3045158 RepID=A0AAU7EHC6_9FLAO|nr:DUF4861 family protein [Mariniflexile sp. KMM 9835]MDQ8210696.1 DUF4861 family protein [Mariniflexile sp. KMM 9835]